MTPANLQAGNFGRIANLHRLTERLIIMTGVALMVIGAIFALPMFSGQRLMMTWVVFACGILGGFVSIQQRVKRISNEELRLMSESWWQLLLIPIFGAVFALVLYCIFLSGILTSNLFPEFSFPQPGAAGPDNQYFRSLLSETNPKSGQDFAKLLFWSFLAGFAERFVPQIIVNLSNAGAGAAPPPPPPQGE